MARPCLVPLKDSQPEALPAAHRPDELTLSGPWEACRRATPGSWLSDWRLLSGTLLSPLELCACLELAVFLFKPG